jgi:hypothetical protein
MMPTGTITRSLHAQMKRQGFSRTITSDGKVYELPSAEYDYSGSITRSPEQSQGCCPTS